MRPPSLLLLLHAASACFLLLPASNGGRFVDSLFALPLVVAVRDCDEVTEDGWMGERVFF